MEDEAMGIFDSVGGALKGIFGQIEAAGAPALISAALAKTNFGDLQGVVTQLQQGGLGDQVKSWLGDGTNLPVTGEQLRAALGSDQVQQLASHFGIPVDAALNLLAEHLPSAVDQASTGGALEPAA
jgi:uncharacterized protein YidB (DUF937 family)